jgi:hypothetical protein
MTIKINYCPFCGVKINYHMRKRGYCGCIAEDYKGSDGIQRYPSGFNTLNYADSYRRKLSNLTIRESTKKTREEFIFGKQTA